MENDPMSMNGDLVGKEYPPAIYNVSAEATMRYARAINEDNSAFLDENRAGGIIAPPLFGVVVAGDAVAKAVGDPDLNINFKMALHGEEDIQFLAPLRPGDEISTTARINGIETKETGETLDVGLTLRNGAGEIVQRQRFVLFVRESTSGGGTKKKGSSEPAGASRGEIPIAVVEQCMDLDQTFRYSEASGDLVRIHLDEKVARKAGLPGIIAHGLCTMGFASKAAIDSLCSGDPGRLARLSVRFARPVIPGEGLTTRFLVNSTGASDGETYSFNMVNPKNAPVLTGGICEVRS